MAAGYSTAAVTMGHLALKRAIRHAEANDLVSRNVANLVDTLWVPITLSHPLSWCLLLEGPSS